MKKFFLIAFVLVIALLTACGDAETDVDESWDSPEQADESAIVENGDQAEPLADAEECLPHEKYDSETDSCYVDISCETEEECENIVADLYDGYDIDLEYWEMTEEDCLPGESYDPEEAACYIECDTDEECLALSDEIYSGLDIYLDESFSGHPSEFSGNDAQNDGELGEEAPPIARYELDENLDLILVSVDETVSNQAYTNSERHQEIWLFTRQILPKNTLKEEVREFHIFTDGPDETLAYVSPLPDDLYRWQMVVDIEDAGTSGQLSQKPDFIHTIIHEFAHIVTLESDQVPPDEESASQEQDSPSKAELTCDAFFTGEGCANGQSYINLFFDRFWLDIYDEFYEIGNAETDEEYDELTEEFYWNYQDQFVSDYAATNPGEDIAESFTFFVLQDKPTGDTIAEQKIRFFYAFAPLVQMRNQIRSQLARANQG